MKIVLEILFFLILMGVIAWFFSIAEYYWSVVGSVIVTYVSFWLMYLLVWHIHSVATKLGVVW